MGYNYEIFLTKKFVPKEDWRNLIKIISDYNGSLRKWKIIIINDKSNIKYYIKSHCSLPATLNNNPSFLFKPVQGMNVRKPNLKLFSITSPDDSIVDLINYNDSRNKGKLIYLEISIRKLYSDKINTKIKYYLKKNKKIKEYRAFFAIPTSILSVDFEANKRYLYKKAPKYLDITKVLNLLDSDPRNGILKIDTFPYLQGDFYLNQNNYNFDKHSVIIGSSGCGKSKFISHLIYNIYKNKNYRENYRVVVIDPHASLEEDIGGLGKVIDFNSELDSINLFVNEGDDIVSSTELLLDLFKSIIADQYNSKLERVLRQAIHLLLKAKSFNFRSLRKVLLDLEFRNGLIKKYEKDLPQSVIDFFLSDFNELKTKSYGEAISPIIAFIDEMELLPIFNSNKEFEKLENTINKNFLSLFSLNRIKLGDKVVKTISGLVMQELLALVQRREINKHVIFIIDEVAVVENPILSRFLSEARKYNLSLVLAGQYFSQISEELQKSIFANVINYFIFRVSKLDADILVDNFNINIPLDNTKEQKVKLLSELSNRCCVARIGHNGVMLPAFKGVTLDYKSIPRKKRKVVVHNEMKQLNEKKTTNNDFIFDTNISLKDILKKTSTSKKGEEYER